MKTSTLLPAILICCVAAQPATKQEVFDGGIFAQALAELYPDENQLIKDVQTATPHSSFQQDALEAAILNKWDGPFTMRDFSKWLSQNHLNGLIRAFDPGIWAGQAPPVMLHAPKDKFDRIDIVFPSGKSIRFVFVVAMDKGVRGDDIEPFLEGVPNADMGDGPIVYDMRPIDFPGSLMHLHERD